MPASTTGDIPPLIPYRSDGQGKRPWQTITAILRDQQIFKDIIQRNKLNPRKTPLRKCFEIAEKDHHLNIDDVETVYEIYKSRADYMMGKLSGALLTDAQETLEEGKRQGLFPLDDVVIPPEPLLSSWEEIFQWLDAMAAMLKRAMGDES